MEKTNEKYNGYIEILKEELVPAMGCTEPIALAFAAAKAREVLGMLPDRVVVGASGSIIKNVKSVIVPNTNHLKGIPAAAVAGIIAGKAEKQLEVLAEVSKEEMEEMKRFLDKVPVEVNYIDNGRVFEIEVILYAGVSHAKVQIIDQHTNIVLIEKDGEIIYEATVEKEQKSTATDRSLLNVEDIVDFAETVDLQDIKEIIARQISCNMAIANEGLRNNYGANIGRVLLEEYGDNIQMKIKIMAAAASDARMNGCELPVIINSGSGNQGITVSVPVIVYAQNKNISEETMYRALLISNLVAIHIKTGIGCLSAYCGAVTAGAAAGAGITYLNGGDYSDICHTIVNSLAITSGMICDGAKASCAAKIASSIDSGIWGYYMYKNGQQFYGGDGIIEKGVENTIRNIGRLGREGMKETNKEIIQMMIGK